MAEEEKENIPEAKNPFKMHTFEFRMESFGYEINFDKLSLYPIIVLYKLDPLEGYKPVYEYRVPPTMYSSEHDNIKSLKMVEELLIAAYWAYNDFLSLKDEYSEIEAYFKALPKNIIIRRNFKA